MEVGELLLADREIGLIGSTCDTEVRLSSAPTRFDLDLRAAGNPADERCNFGELHVEFSLLDIGLGCLYLGVRPSFAWISVSSWLCAMAFLGPAVCLVQRLGWPCPIGISCASCAFAWSSAALKDGDRSRTGFVPSSRPSLPCNSV